MAQYWVWINEMDLGMDDCYYLCCIKLQISTFIWHDHC